MNLNHEKKKQRTVQKKKPERNVRKEQKLYEFTKTTWIGTKK